MRFRQCSIILIISLSKSEFKSPGIISFCQFMMKLFFVIKFLNGKYSGSSIGMQWVIELSLRDRVQKNYVRIKYSLSFDVFTFLKTLLIIFTMVLKLTIMSISSMDLILLVSEAMLFMVGSLAVMKILQLQLSLIKIELFIYLISFLMDDFSKIKLKDYHGTIQTIAWFGLPNLALWALYFKHYQYAPYIHGLCMGTSSLLMITAAMIMLVEHGPDIITKQIIHQTIGFSLFLLIPIILTSGSICKISQSSPNTQPTKVSFNNKAHSIFGWIFLLMTRLPLYSGEDDALWLGFIIAVDVISFSSYLYLKFFRKQISSVSVNKENIEEGLRLVRVEKDFRIYSNDYFIFADYVYSIYPLLGVHPGGWRVIQQIRTREVDRFLYGMESVEIYSDLARNSHSLNCLNLAGPPIAILSIPNPYPSLIELNPVCIEKSYSLNDKSSVHIVYLKSLYLELFYAGYADLCQIGQYYALTISKKTTRLYTAVNFLQSSNIQLMEIISKGMTSLKQRKNGMKEANLEEESEIVEELIKNKDNESSLPLFMKKYDDGIFTSQFFGGKVEDIVISKPRGRGLCLQDVKLKNVVMLAAGTGLYPFSDTIDLLFKQMLLQQKHPQSFAIQQNDPILKSLPFKKFKFQLYISVQNTNQLHPITLYQCNQLSRNGKLICKIKTKNEAAQFYRKYEKIMQINEQFQNVIRNLHKDEKEPCQYYICGPTRFSRKLVEQIRALQITSYRIV